MLERDFKGPAFSGSERRPSCCEPDARFAQHHLRKLIGEFHGELDVFEGAFACIDQFSVKRSHFLMQEVLGAAEREIFNLDFWGVGLFDRTKREMHFPGPGRRAILHAGPDVNRQGDGHRSRSHPRNPGAAALRLPGRFYLWSLMHGMH